MTQPAVPDTLPRRQGRSRNSEFAQRALLAAGARLFADRGYEATTLEEIAAAAGFTKAMVRYHFEDKAGLYRAVVAEAIDYIADAIGTVRDAKLAPEEKLSRYIATLAEAIRARPHMGRLLISDYAAGRLSKDADFVENLLRLFLTTKAVLAEGRKQGAFRKLDPHLFHLWLVGSIVYFVSSQPFRDDMQPKPAYRGPEPRFAAFVKQLQEMALRGVAAD
ncbi:MAG: TetR family transcriptional regulator [Hyphomonadaceae bacterium]